MAELISGVGFLYGKTATMGFYSVPDAPPPDFVDLIEKNVGLSPLIRARIFVKDNDDWDYDLPSSISTMLSRLDEQGRLLNVGNISKSIEYDTNKTSMGGCSIKLLDTDQQWADNNPKSITYIDRSTARSTWFRYHNKRVIIELGFDNINKDNDNYWFPMFSGLITQKIEDAEKRTVSISLKDEFKRLFDYDLAPTVTAKDYITYNQAVPIKPDNRRLQLGTYFGKHEILEAEILERDNQLLIPCTWNEEGPADVLVSNVLSQSQTRTLMLPLIDDIFTVNGDFTAADKKIWFWLWNDISPEDATDPTTPDNGAWPRVNPASYITGWQGSEVTNPALGQWAYIKGNQFRITDRGDIDFNIGDGTTLRNFRNKDGTTILILSFDDYFARPDTTSEQLDKYDPLVGFAATLESNPVKILYNIVVRQVGINERELDLLFTTDINLSVGIDAKMKDQGGNIVYIDKLTPVDSIFSWNDAFHYLRDLSASICVNINKTTRASKLIDDLSAITRGGFFITRGYKQTILPALPRDLTLETTFGFNTRRIKFVIHHPVNIVQSQEITEVYESDIKNPKIVRKISDIINSTSVSNFDYATTTAHIKDIETHLNEDSNSIADYGRKRFKLNFDSNDILFLYDSTGYAQFLASHFTYVFAEPPATLSFEMNLKGMSFDNARPQMELKDLVSVNELQYLNLTGDSDPNGIFEVKSIRFNTKNFSFKYELIWAGYLIAPDGDVNNKSWAFFDQSNFDADANGLTYHFW